MVSMASMYLLSRTVHRKSFLKALYIGWCDLHRICLRYETCQHPHLAQLSEWHGAIYGYGGVTELHVTYVTVAYVTAARPGIKSPDSKAVSCCNDLWRLDWGVSRSALQGGDLQKVMGIESIGIPPHSARNPEILTLRRTPVTQLTLQRPPWGSN